MNIAKQYDIVINPRKTKIVKLCNKFKLLQIHYTLTNTGKVLKKLTSSTITRMRKRLKAYKRLLDKNILTQERIDDIFKSWIGSFYKVMSSKQLENMFKLYFNLFKRRLLWKKHSKLHYLTTQYMTI